MGELSQLSGAHCNSHSKSGTTHGNTILLHTAVEQGDLDMLKSLLSQLQASDPSTQHGSESPRTPKQATQVEKHRDAAGNTVLHTACTWGVVDIVRFLTDTVKCDPNCKSNSRHSPLHYASGSGHIDVVRYLVECHKCDPLSPAGDGDTSLHVAASHGKLEVVKYFTNDVHCDPSTRNCISDDTPLHTAATNGHSEVVRFLIEDKKCDPMTRGVAGSTPLHGASAQGHLDTVKYLVDTHQCDPLCADDGDNTPVHCAAAGGQMEVLRFFLATAKIAVTHIGGYGNTPHNSAMQAGHTKVVKYLFEELQSFTRQNLHTFLHSASTLGLLDIVKYLVNKKQCDPLYLCKETTPLHVAAAEGHLEVLKYLTVTKMCDPQVRSADSDTPLHCAARNGHLEVVKFLAGELKCNQNTKNAHGETPLHCSSSRGHLQVVRYLVETHRCDPLHFDGAKETSLHLAALAGNLKTVQFFVTDCKCDATTKNGVNDTSLHVAAREGHLEVVKFLVDDTECDVNGEGNQGSTPLLLAIQNGHANVSKFLIDVEDCDVSARDFKDVTPLYLAVKKQNLDIVEYLTTARRLDPYMLPDKKRLVKAAQHSEEMTAYMENYTDPLHRAVTAGNLDAVRLYTEMKNWCPNMPDRQGNNALHNAAQHGQLAVVKYLTGICDDPWASNNRVLCGPHDRNRHGLTAQEIASKNGHNDVTSYLLRITSRKSVTKKDTISPSINVFVIGNSRSGKSTLVKALSKEKGVLGKLVKVKGVVPMTSGIEPTHLDSEWFGNVVIYDFAGHEEYYASHEVILRQTPQPLVLITINISLTRAEILKQLNYWCTIITNSSSTESVNVIVIGSHTDRVKVGERKEISERVTALLSQKQVIKFRGFVDCDCRYSTSESLNQIRQSLDDVCKKLRLLITYSESDYFNKLSAALKFHLMQNEQEKVTITVGEVCEQISQLKSPGQDLEKLAEPKLLIETCRNLSRNGNLLFLPHEDDVTKSLLVLKERVILDKAHMCLTEIKRGLANEFGILGETQLKRVLSNSLKDLLEPELAIKYLIFTQFCTEITTTQLVPSTGDNNSEGETHYFFPNIASASRPTDMWSTGEQKYTHLYTWCLRCTKPFEFFTPRYLHTLFIQLIKSETDTSNTKYTIWKDGAQFVHSNGTNSMIEVTDQTTRVYLVIRCMEGYEAHLVRQRSLLTSLIKSLLRKVCPKVQTEECLFLPQHTYPPPQNSTEVSIADLARSVIHGYPSVSHKSSGKSTLEHIHLKSLLYFDSFHAMPESTLQEIFIQRQSSELVHPNTVKRICRALEPAGSGLAEKFQDESEHEITYRQLYDNLAQYSLFTDGNLYVSLVIATCMHCQKMGHF